VSLLKKLSELYDVNEDVLINEIKTNSREIQKGDMFVCIKGIGVDRHDFIDEAIENGASCLMVERKGDYKVPAVKVENANVELGLLSKKFYDDPLKSLKLIGITGTDGKTTTASIIRNMLGNKKCGYIGTNGIYCLDENKKTIAEITYEEIEDGIFNINHTFVDESMQGQGIASKLVQEAVNDIKSKNGTVQATCSYAKKWLEKNCQ